MKTVHEIFKDNPKLLEEPEVKELLEQFKIQFMKIKNSKTEFWMKVTDLTMRSNFFIKDGLECEDVVEKIHNIAFEN